MPLDLALLRSEMEARLDDLAEAVTRLAQINSGSFNAAGVDECGSLLAAMGESLAPDAIDQVAVGPTITLDEHGRRHPVDMGRALVMSKRPDARFRVCVFGHLDTVFGPDHEFQTVARNGSRLNGPGVADCKGGLVIALEALRFLDTTPWGGHVGWDFVAVPDEEVGSHGSKSLLADTADNCSLGLGVEPALPGGAVAGARKGSLTLHAVIRGSSAHVGRAHHEGRSAIAAAAALVDRLEAANSEPGVTVNCGQINGGGALNVVPDFATAGFNIRVETPANQSWITDAVASAAADIERRRDVEVTIEWMSSRPPKIRTPELDTVLADVETAGTLLDAPTPAEDTGGSCDGNDLAAAGLVNVDSLGIRGGAIHSPDEYADVSSIPDRVATMAHVIHEAQRRFHR